MVTQNESDTEGEEVAAPLPVQSTTMLNFFKRLQPAKEAEAKQPKKDKDTLLLHTPTGLLPRPI